MAEHTQETIQTLWKNITDIANSRAEGAVYLYLPTTRREVVEIKNQDGSTTKASKFEFCKMENNRVGDLSPTLNFIRREKMKLTSFLRKLGLTEGDQEKLVREITKCFGLLPTQYEVLRVNKNLCVYPVHYPERARPIESFFDDVFREDEIQLLVFDIFRTLHISKEVKNDKGNSR